MTIEQLRRLKTLSEIPTHSPASLEELKELVRIATIRVLVWKCEDAPGAMKLCDWCEKRGTCKSKHPHYNLCETQKEFQLRMDSEGGD